MAGVTRDTSGDAMREALAVVTEPDVAPTDEAMRQLWGQRRALKAAIEDLLRIAVLHGKGPRLAWREREQTRQAQQAGVVACAHLDDVENKARTAARRNNGEAANR